MRMHAGRQAQARQRTRRRIGRQGETRRIGAIGQMSQLIAASGQHLARTLHRFGQARLRLSVPAVETLEHVRGVLLHVDDIADEVHAPRRAARELQRRIGQQVHMRVRVHHRAGKARRLHKTKPSVLALLSK